MALSSFHQSHMSAHAGCGRSHSSVSPARTQRPREAQPAEFHGTFGHGAFSAQPAEFHGTFGHGAFSAVRSPSPAFQPLAPAAAARGLGSTQPRLRSRSPGRQVPLLGQPRPCSPSPVCEPPLAWAAPNAGPLAPDQLRRMLLSTPTAARGGAAVPSAEAALRPCPPAAARSFAPPARRATSSSRARPQPELPAPQVAASVRDLESTLETVIFRKQSVLVRFRKRVRFGVEEVFEVESYKAEMAQMEELQDPLLKICMDCDVCGKLALRAQRSEGQRTICRMAKMVWICTTCQSERPEEVEARCRESARSEAATRRAQMDSAGCEEGPLEVPALTLAKVRAAAEMIAPGDARRGESHDASTPPRPAGRKPAQRAAGPDGSSRKAKRAGVRPAFADDLPSEGPHAIVTLAKVRAVFEMMEEGAKRAGERLDYNMHPGRADGGKPAQGAAAATPRRAAADAPEQPRAAQPGPGKEAAMAARSTSRPIGEETGSLSEMERLLRAMRMEAKDLMPRGVLDPLMEAVESAIARASSAATSCQSLADVLKGEPWQGGCPLSSVDTL